MEIMTDRRSRSSNICLLQVPVLAAFSLITFCMSFWLLNLTRDSVDELHYQEVATIQRMDKHFIITFFNQTNPIIAGVSSGVTTLAWCWLLTYFNWLHVGSFPATPLSPNRKLDPSSRPAILALSGFIPLAIGMTVTFLVWQHMARG